MTKTQLSCSRKRLGTGLGQPAEEPFATKNRLSQAGNLLLALLVLKTLSAAPEQVAGPGSNVVYSAGHLTIDARNTTLADLLTRVAFLTGAKIELPPGANNEPMPVVKLGPGSPREVLASLLRDSHLNFVIEGSESDPEQIKSVLLMPGSVETDRPDVPARSMNARAVEPVSEPVLPDPPTPTTQEATAAQAIVPEPAVAPDPSAIGATPQSRLGLTNLTPTSNLSPPATLTPETINQQLQQMYQQRMQIVQQDRQAVSPGPAGSR